MIKNYELKFIIFTLFFLSILGTIFQSIYTYDGFHWGLIANSSIEILKGKIPYKEVFIHYGFFFTLTNAFILKLFNFDLIHLLSFSGIFLASGNLILVYLIKKFTNNDYAALGALIIFLCHPFANYPTYNYLFFFLITCFFFFLTKKSKYSFIFSGFFLALASLTYENFLFLSIAIIFLVFLFYRTKFFFILIGYLIPILIFQMYLYLHELTSLWFNVLNLNKVFMEYLNIDFLILIKNYIIIFTESSLKNIFTETYYLFFLFLGLSNIIFILFYSKRFKQDENIKFLIFLSVCSLLFYSFTFHKLNILRYSTGPIIGIVSFLFIFNDNKFKFFNKLILLFFTLFLISSTITPIKTENNRFFPNLSEISDGKSSSQLSFFKSQKWNERTWKNLLTVNKFAINIKKKCPEINQFFNYTNDAFYFIILNQYFNNEQYLPWYLNENYYNTLMKYFNKNFQTKLKKNLINKNILVIINTHNSLNFLKKFNLENYKIIQVPYSYQHKNLSLILPKKCYQEVIL